MATILMKLSEERAVGQYDRWIGLLTLFQDRVMRNYIIENLLPRRGRVIDVGCGTGKILVEAGRRGLRGVGIDMNESMLEIARERSRRHNLSRRIEFKISSATDLGQPDDHYDILVSTFMISELQINQLKEFLSEAKRVVKPGGTVVIGGEGRPRSGLFERFVYLIRKASYFITAKTSSVAPHPYHKVASMMKYMGLRPKYRLSFLGGVLELNVAEVEQ